MSNKFGEQLRSARIRNGYNQSELAERLKVSQGTISNWEKNKSCPDQDQFSKLKRIIGISKEAQDKENEEAQSEVGPSPLGTWLNRTSTAPPDLRFVALESENPIAAHHGVHLHSFSQANRFRTRLSRASTANFGMSV